MIIVTRIQRATSLFPIIITIIQSNFRKSLAFPLLNHFKWWFDMWERSRWTRRQNCVNEFSDKTCNNNMSRRFHTYFACVISTDGRISINFQVEWTTWFHNSSNFQNNFYDSNNHNKIYIVRVHIIITYRSVQRTFFVYCVVIRVAYNKSSNSNEQKDVVKWHLIWNFVWKHTNTIQSKSTRSSTVRYMKSTHLHYCFARIGPFHWNVFVGLARLVWLDHFILHNDHWCCWVSLSFY